MDPLILQWITLITVFSLAVLSPGPDFVMAVRNSVLYSRRAGIFTALGFGAGVLIHVTYTIFGIAAIIAESVMIFNMIKWAGAAYLVYIGYHALRSKGMGQKVIDEAREASTDNAPRTMSAFKAFRGGFLTNALNPKATLFFLAIFSQIIRHDTPIEWQALYGLTCAVMVVVWFSVVAVVLTHAPVRALFLKASRWIDRVCGALLITLGIKVALTTR